MRTDAESKVLSLGRRAPNARQALNLMYRKPMLSAADLQQELQTTNQTANALLRDFMQLGLLREVTGAYRHRFYVFDSYIALFSK